MSTMNRRNFVKTAVTGAAIAGVSAPAVVLAGEKKMRLSMQTYWGKEADGIFKTFTDNVKVASKKSLRIKRHPGGAIVPDAEMFSAVSKGTLDMCESYSGYWPSKLDIATLESGIVGAWVSSDEAAYMFDKTLLASAREAYAEHNIHYLGAALGGGYDLLTKKPVKSLDDLKKMKIRATPSVAKVLQKFGIPTVFMPASELYVGLSTGAIDGVIYGSTLEYTTMKLFEVAKHYTTLNMLMPGFVDCILINMDKWKSLSDSQRAILEMGVAQHSTNLHNWLMGALFDPKYTSHFEFSALPASDAKRLREAAGVLWEEEAKKSARNKKIVDLFKEVAKTRS